jgi:chemotaxis response regulator CheB
MMRILIADDYADTRIGLRTVLEMSPKLKVCGEATSGAQAVEMAKSLKPDAIVLDLRMPGGNGVEAAGKINAAMPNVPIVLLSMYGSLLEQGMTHPGVQKIFTKNEVGSLRTWLESLDQGGSEKPASKGTDSLQTANAAARTGTHST